MSNNLDTTIKVKLIDDGKLTVNETMKPINVELRKVAKKTRKNRLILLLSILSIVLAIGLIFCLVRYQICNSNAAINLSLSSKKSPCSSISQSRFNNTIKTDHENAAMNWNDSRLPFNLKPYLYDVNLRINVYDKVFNGTASINFKCLKTISFAVIHSDPNLGYDFSAVKIYELMYNDQLGQMLQIKNITYNTFYSYFIFHLDNSFKFMSNRNYRIIFGNYNSTITNNLKGIYYSTYVANNVTKTIIVSQLQPLEARKVFPSFDEPSLKAQFLITIEHHSEFTALSNMEEVMKIRLDKKWSQTIFNITPIMSTYLLAFTVSDFKPISTTGPNNLKIRVWARDDYANNTQYALNIIPKAYVYFEDYFQIKEVVPKSDHFAAPDFNAGAMENWGLVLYRESALLFDPEKSLLEDEYFIMLVICHEISHSWFGNMATFKWWDNVWLNEAFANTLMYLAMNHINPEFNVLETLVVHDIFNVMEKDSVETSHPVSTHVDDPTQVQQYFDEISYEKGLSVLRMLRGVIGDDLFRQSLRNHINKYMFSNCDMDELWQVISETIDYKYNISEIMTNWITQEGYPIIHVTKVENKNSLHFTYKLRQEYFLLSQPQVKKNYKWVIPFTYKFASAPNQKHIVWLNLTDNEIVVPSTKNKWILGNLDFMGYYRVNYDIENWKLIIKQLKIDHSVFTPVERAALIFDSFTLARVGMIDYSLALDLSSYLNKETEFVPWKSFFKSITYLDNMLSSSSCYGLFQSYCAKQINDIYKTLGWKDKGTFMHRLLRNHVIKYAAYFEIEDAVKKSRSMFEEFLNGTKQPEKHVIEAVYCSGIKYGTNKNWLDLLNRTINAIPTEQNVIFQALVCSRETWILKMLLELTLDHIQTIIRKSDIRRIYTFFTFTPISRKVYFDFVIKNWEKLLQLNSHDAFIMSSIIESLTVGTNNEDSFEKIAEILSDGAGSASNSVEYALDQIRSNIKWVQNHEKSVCQFLNSNY